MAIRHLKRGKPEADRALGLEGVRAIREAVPEAPLVAIGGINLANAADVAAAGADGVAVVSAIMSAPDPEAAPRKHPVRRARRCPPWPRSR